MIPNDYNGNNRMFTQAFASLNEDELEAYHRTVFMHMDHPQAEKVRCDYYRSVFRSMGDNVRIGVGVKVVNPQWITIGDGVRIGDHVTLIARGEQGITLGSETILKDRVYLDSETKVGFIRVGWKVYIGTGCCFHGHEGLTIGDQTLMAQNITITPYSHIFEDKDHTIRGQGGNKRPVTIGHDCYIGMNCSILYSADIGDGSIVGAGSVVVKPVEPYTVVVGVPAKPIRRRGK
ncbi:MAG: transferase [Paenibacillaceae bacterium]|jgi:acetyltransferase-like isoleucine patch superfamily enzyme|nr:transferase [Paenibacillaceae bacterium]